MAHDVFISHSAKNKTVADAACATLESSGVRCWIAPRDVVPGMQWGECIVEAIEQSRIMVLVFTAAANASPQIHREVERAITHGVAILPLRVEDVHPGRALEYFIGNVHWLDALTPPLEAHLKILAGTVKVLLARMEPHDAILVQPAAAAPPKSDTPEPSPPPANPSTAERPPESPSVGVAEPSQTEIPEKEGTSRKAIGSLVCGIAGFFVPFLGALAAVVLGHMARTEIRRSEGRLSGAGMALAGLILGYVSLGAMILIIMAGIAIPNLMHSRMAANQAAAVGSLRTINTAAITYSSTYGNGYPRSLAALGPPAGNDSNGTCDNANLIDSVLSTGRHNGYVFYYGGANPLPRPAPKCASPGFNAYAVNADPEIRGKTGEASYFTDESGVIRFNKTQPASANDPPLALP